jgi:hypothetical protein
MRMRRVWIRFFLVLACASAFAASPDPTSFWDQSITVRSWSGYKDNVLLGNVNVEESPLLGAGLDLMLLRLSTSGTEFYFFVSGDFIYYPDAEQAENEKTLIAQARLKKPLGAGWEIGTAMDYLFFDQVFDASTLDRELASVRALGHSVGVRPFIRKNFGRKNWFETELVLTRQQFKDLLDDYWEIGPIFTLGREFGYKSSVALSYQFFKRVSDTRSPRDLDGRLLEGTLEDHRHEVTLAWRQHWDEKRRWRTTTKIGFERNFDNGTGYYDFLRPILSEQIRFRAGTWELRAEAKLSHYDYDLQRVSDTDPSLRAKTNLNLEFRVEKELIRNLKIFAAYEHERSISNLATDEYKVNTSFGGIEFEF